MFPFAMVEPCGVTEMLESTAAVTVRVVEPLMVPEVALMVVVPTDAAVASPWLPTEFEMLAAPVEDPHVAVVVRSWVLPSV